MYKNDFEIRQPEMLERWKQMTKKWWIFMILLFCLLLFKIHEPDCFEIVDYVWIECCFLDYSWSWLISKWHERSPFDNDDINFFILCCFVFFFDAFVFYLAPWGPEWAHNVAQKISFWTPKYRPNPANGDRIGGENAIWKNRCFATSLYRLDLPKHRPLSAWPVAAICKFVCM